MKGLFQTVMRGDLSVIRDRATSPRRTEVSERDFCKSMKFMIKTIPDVKLTESCNILRDYLDNWQTLQYSMNGKYRNIYIHNQEKSIDKKKIGKKKIINCKISCVG